MRRPPLASHPSPSGLFSFVDGAFVDAEPERELEVRSPADRADVVAAFRASRALVDRAVESARAAQRPFRKLGLEARATLLRSYQARLRVHTDALAASIAREVGKPLWEARAEVAAMIGKVELSLGEGLRFTETRSLPDLPGEIRYRAHGVLAVIGPFNFPGHLPNGQLVPALALGNTVVFKPSEKTPLTAAWMARCFEEAGFPPGVVQIVQGDGHVAGHLAAHDGIDGVLFTGSAEVGRRILAANAHRPGRLVALELGGKNSSLVLADADVERAAREVAFSAFATAGQRCTATSRVIVQRAVADQLCDRLATAAKAAVVGYPFDEGVFLGPLISFAARERLLEALRCARAAGFAALAEGGAVEIPGCEGSYVRPSVHVAPSQSAHAAGYTGAELFGPDLAVTIVDTDEEALRVANDSPYGLAAAVYTAERARFEALADDLEVGVVHWNRSSAGASGRLPFGGIKDSGNHRPAGILAGVQCAAAIGVYLAPGTGAPLPSWPGLSF